MLILPVVETLSCIAQTQKDCSNMDFNTIIQTVLGIGFTILGWFARELWNAVKILKQDLTALEISINRDYVRYDRLQDAFKPIMEALTEIKDTLKTKADK